MATNPATGYSSDSSTRGKIVATVIGTSDNPSNNTTTVTWSIVVADGNSSTGGYNYNQPSGTGARATGNLYQSGSPIKGSLSGTTTYDGGWGSYDFGSGVISSPHYPRSSGTLTATLTHADDGTASPVYAYGYLNGGSGANSGPLGNASATTSNIGITAFVPPSAPSVSINRAGDGTSFSISASGSSGGTTWTGSSISYVIEYSINGGTWYSYSSGSISTNSADYVDARALARTGTNYGWQSSATTYATQSSGVAPSAPTSISVTRSGTSITATASGSTGASSYSVVINGSTYSNGGTATNITPGTTLTIYAYATNSIGNSSSYLYTGSISKIPNLPTIFGTPTITTPVGYIKQRTIDWSSLSTNLDSAAFSYYVLEYSTDGINFSTLTTTTNTSYTTTDLTIAQTYYFRVSIVSDVGQGSPSSVSSTFISAYGYRYDTPTTRTAVQYAAKNTGISSDTIVVNGTTYTGWKLLSGIKRFDGTSWIDLTQ
jgi:hypothetical protein